jgi:hypothetical protein
LLAQTAYQAELERYLDRLNGLLAADAEYVAIRDTEALALSVIDQLTRQLHDAVAQCVAQLGAGCDPEAFPQVAALLPRNSTAAQQIIVAVGTFYELYNRFLHRFSRSAAFQALQGESTASLETTLAPVRPAVSAAAERLALKVDRIPQVRLARVAVATAGRSLRASSPDLDAGLVRMATLVRRLSTGSGSPALVTGAGAGGGPHVIRRADIDEDGRRDAVTANLFAYDPGFTGGVRVALCDVNVDGVPDIVTGAGPGGGPHVRVFDGETGEVVTGPIGSFMAYDPSFSGGIFLACADVNGDGAGDIVTGAGGGGGPHVRVFSGATGAELIGLFAYDPRVTSGINVAACDVNGDGRAEIVTAPGPGAGPHVRIFDGLTAEPLPGPIGSFFAYDPAFSGGVAVACGEVTGDGLGDIVTGAGPGGGPHVQVFDGASGALAVGAAASFFAYDPGFRGGVVLTVADVSSDGRADVVTGAGPGGGPHIRVIDVRTGNQFDTFFAYAATFTGGLSVAGAP